jgi:iron complex outermembrane receptor protein
LKRRDGSSGRTAIPGTGGFFLFLLPFLLALFPPQAVASGGIPGDLTSLSLEELMEIEVVYAASRYEQDVHEAPSSVTIVGADEIRRFGYRTLADLLAGVGGFYTSYDRIYTYLGTRGFSRPGDYNTRFLLQVDGHRLNDEVYGQAFIGTEFPLDLDVIDRVEIIRGPSSSIYGTNALFGVVNVVTKKGRDLDGVRLSGRAASFGTRGTGVAFGKEHPSGMEIFLSGGYAESDGQDLYYAEFDDPATNDGVAEDSDRDASKSAYARFAYKGITLQGFYGWRKKGIPTAPWEVTFNDPRTVAVDARGYVELLHTRNLGRGIAIDGDVSYNWYGYDGDYAYEYDSEDEGGLIATLSSDYARGEWLRGGLSLSAPAAGRHHLVVGSTYRHDFRLHQKYFDEETVYLDDERTSWSWALYALDEIRVVEGLLMNIGVRHDRYETFGGTTHPRLALIWDPLEATTLKLLYGSAFRAPNVFELYYTDEDGGEPTQKANLDLDPEIVRTYELVVEQDLGTRIQGSVSMFHTEATDLIGIETDPDDGLLVFRNLDETHSTGFEVGFRGSLRKGCSSRLSYTYQESEDSRTGETLTNSPKHLAKLGVLVPVLGERLSAGFELRYTGDRKTPQGGTAEGYFLGNLTLASRLLGGRLELSASAYNLFDQEYFDPGSEEHVQNLIEQDGRSFGVKASIGW